MNKSISEGDVYEKGGKIRRVIAVVKDVVAYSNGGDRNGYCKYKTFMRWVGGKNSSTKKVYEAQS